MIISISMAFLLISFIYAVITNIFFFSKKRVKTKENKIFGKMLILNIIGIILEVFCIYSDPLFGKTSTTTAIVNKIFLIFLLTFFTEFSLYILNSVELSDEQSTELKKKIYKIIKITIYIVIVLSIIGVCFLDIHLYVNGWKIYSYGPAANLVFIVGFLCLIWSVIYLLINLKNTNKNKKRNTPIMVFVVSTIIMTMIQSKYPYITLANSIITLLNFLLYHSIENPMITQLEIAKNVATEANNAKTDFLSSMSHEIRTPLNAIVGLSQVIEVNDNVEEIHRDTREIFVASQKLLEIINCILDANKLETNQLEIVNKDYKIINILNDLVHLITVMKESKDIEIVTKFSSDLPMTLNGDVDKIKRIITNLLTNAVKYTDKGFIYFNVSCINKDDICTLTIEVKDTGRGMDEVQQSKLFQQFYRLDSDKDSDISGAGLGLSITKSFVELLDGEIKVESVPGEGSTFTVVIPQKIVQLNSNEEMEVL